MSQLYKVPLILSPQPEGGYTVTSPVLPELITEGSSLEEVMENVRDALDAARDLSGFRQTASCKPAPRHTG